MICDLEKLNDYNIFEIVHNGNKYRATIRRGMYSDYPFELFVEYVQWETKRYYLEYSNSFKTAASALNKLKRYWKGETVEWNRI